MILKKISASHQIIAEKQKNGLYSIYNKVKNIFGNGWQKTVIKSGFTLAQVNSIKNALN